MIPYLPQHARGEIKDNIKQVVSDRFPAWNPAFDVTPARYITAFITERGILKPNQIKAL